MLGKFNCIRSVGDLIGTTLMLIVAYALMFPFFYMGVYFAQFHSFFAIIVVSAIALEILAAYVIAVVLFFKTQHEMKLAQKLPDNKKMLYYLADRRDY